MNVSTIIDAASLARDPEQTSGMMSEVLARVQDLKDFYPSFDLWLVDQVIPGVHAGDRSILAEYRRGELAALAILKDDGLEKKLCCLRVLPDFKNITGLGIRMFEKSFEVLGTEQPLLSVSEERLPTFDRIFSFFGFEKSKAYEGLYRPNATEFAFNGELRGERRAVLYRDRERSVAC